MQFVKDGPDIPERLLQAHEEGRVVFFAGAGISYPAGLPGFGGLVAKLYAGVGTSPNSVEAAALKDELYDTAIGLLEGRVAGGRAEVRAHLKTILKPNWRRAGAKTTHEALLNLGQSRSGQVRLVTTNFDRIFEKVIVDHKLPVPTFCAPLLPVPKNRWNGLVYLHGLLTKAPTPDDLNRLVAASGDFGLAYLIERWAARFVAELLRTYTVCFVGYSINDPVMRYMMDALAADKLMGETPSEAFAFGSYLPGRADEAALDWKTKNVTPILYPDSKTHSHFHETLHAWAATYRDGVRGKEAIVARYVTVRPTGSTRQDNFVGRMLWALSDETGLPAKSFADFDPVPSLEWLEPFTDPQFKHSDLTRFGVQPNKDEDKKLSFSLLARPTSYVHASWMVPVQHEPGRFGSWDDVMGHLARWLARHIDDPKLLLWVARRGGRLHPNFQRVLLRELEVHPPSASMQTLWRLVFAGQLKVGWGSSDLYSLLRSVSRSVFSASLRLQLRQALTPCITLSEPFSLPAEEESGEEDVDLAISDLVRWEIVLAADHPHSALEEASKSAEWRAALVQMLHDFTSLLADALDLMKELGGASARTDRSYIHQPSIGDHSQNNDFNDWTILIILARDAWLATATGRPDVARAEARRWARIGYPVFKRLAFFAAAQPLSPITAAEGLHWLLDDNGWWLWTIETQRETLQLLGSLSPRISQEQNKELLAFILAGPPRDLFREDLPSDALQRAVDREVWLLLSKIEVSGGTLTPKARTRLRSISRKYPQWHLAADGRDEFPYWTSDGEEWRTHRPTPKSRRELEAWLREFPTVDDLHDVDNWAERCASDFPRAATALMSLAAQGYWPVDRWRQALQAWSSEALAELAWRYVAPALNSVPEDVLAALARPVGWWLEIVGRTIHLHEVTFFALIRGILTACRDEALSLDGDLQAKAINHPIGLATEALLRWWYRQNLEDGQKLRGEIEPFLTEICQEGIASFQLGRIILARNIIALYRVDRQWTQSNLLKYFDWDRSEALSVWQSFLQSPRLYWPLLDNLKEPFLAIPQKLGLMTDTYRAQFLAFLTYAALEPDGSFTPEDFKKAFESLAPADLAKVADTLSRALESAGDQRAEFFENRIEPFLKRLWPKSQEAKTDEVSKSVARICASAGVVFPLALSKLRHWLQPIEDFGFVVHQLHAAELDRRFPADALTFLHLVVPAEVRWLSDKLRECLRVIKAADVTLELDARFQRLVTLLRQKGQEWP